MAGSFAKNGSSVRTGLSTRKSPTVLSALHAAILGPASWQSHGLRQDFALGPKAPRRLKLTGNLKPTDLQCRLGSRGKIPRFQRQNVASLLSEQNETTRKENRYYISCIIDVIAFCAVQGMAFRGHREMLKTEEDGNNVAQHHSGNFFSLLALLSKYDSIVESRLKEGPQNAKYTAPDVQNEVIAAVAGLIREKISVQNSENYFAIIADEARDTSHQQQLSLVLRYVGRESGSCEVKESFLGFVPCATVDARGLSESILMLLRDNGIALDWCVAQCYDGASVMSGHISGVQTRIREVSKHAMYLHCFAHRLNLVIVDVVHNTARAKDLFDVLQLLHNFLSQPLMHNKFVEAQKCRKPEQRIREIPSLSDTRWVCRLDACESIAVCLPAIIDTLEALMDEAGERGAAARAINAQLDTSFVVHLCCFKYLLKLFGQAQEELQGRSETLDKALGAIEEICSWLKESDNMWDSVYNEAKNISKDADLPEPRMKLVSVGAVASSGDYKEKVYGPMCQESALRTSQAFYKRRKCSRLRRNLRLHPQQQIIP